MPVSPTIQMPIRVSCFSNLEKLAVRLDDLQTRQKPDQDGNFRKRDPWENGACWPEWMSVKACSSPVPVQDSHFSFLRGSSSLLRVWKGFFLETRGLLSISLLLFPSCLLISWRKQPSLVLPVLLPCSCSQPSLTPL